MARNPMRAPRTANTMSSHKPSDVSAVDEGSQTTDIVRRTKRSAYVILALFVLVINGCWAVHHYQFEAMPVPLAADQAGKRGFSEEEAMKHVKALTGLGPHPVGSNALDLALQYVLGVAETIKKTAHWEVDVQVDFFHVSSGANRLASGLFKGKTLVYSDLNHIVLRILPKYASEAEENAILVSSHIDSVVSAEGAGDCSSCVAVMLELARGISHWAHGFKNAVIFLFNTGEEEGLNGAHSFVTQHPWSDSVRLAIDLEAMGIGGKSAIFQAGPHPWAIENFAMVAKYPSAQILAQDLYSSGAIKSGTDFQVYKELAGLSGLDFAYADNTAVYHTKVTLSVEVDDMGFTLKMNDKLKLLKPGSLQHLGENMLAFLVHSAAFSRIPNDKPIAAGQKAGQDTAVYFDILGTYMIVFRQRFANLLYNSVIMQSLMIWTTSLLMGGYSAAISLALSCLSVILMWICSLSLSVLVAFILPLISSTPAPFVSSPWLVFGLFAAPALLGALTGQYLGYQILHTYLMNVSSRRRGNLSQVVQADLAKLDAERWLFKSGLVQWFVLLLIGNYYKIGSSYLPFVWLVSPAFAYGLLEATLSPARLPKPLKTITLLMGLSLPFLISAGMFIRLASTIIGTVVRFDRNPGSTPEWLGNAIVAIYIAVIICLTLVYLLSCVHFSGFYFWMIKLNWELMSRKGLVECFLCSDPNCHNFLLCTINVCLHKHSLTSLCKYFVDAKTSIILATCLLFGLSIAAVLSGIIPPFTEDTSRAVNVVHVVDTTGTYGEKLEPSSYVSLFSTTPGKLTKEIEQIGEGFVCGRDKVLDFVTFSVKYGCWTEDNVEGGWSELDIPTLHVESDTKADDRNTQISIDTKSSIRWSLAINTEQIEDFKLKDSTEELIPLGGKSSADGWHIIQFSGGKSAPKTFELSLYWANNSTKVIQQNDKRTDRHLLLKLRTDVDRLTPKAERVLEKLPSWCSLFGKSTSPHTLAFLSSVPVNF
ncbi:hypothetical protein RHSIM_Rhsim09G0151500 [Rhododendron simsii]|uniref:Vacuolar membrane protease n=1 Tax=Rhododendron simsii TaxID=118357 RepID=A0A834GH54_RHOSS|nr:hypothetical protein RHSIM_Rhsim09G0151500 [Rhododendron simsii]